MEDFFKNTFPSYTSNSFKNLAKKCIENISLQPNTSKTYLAYPSNEAKDYFIQSFIDKNSYIFGIRFITIQQFIHLSLKICYKKDLLFPSHYELMFFLEEEIASLLESDHEMTKPLKEYISEKNERITSLASNLSHTFLEYMLYGQKALPSWIKKNNWQQYLFKEVLKKWTCIIDAIQNLPPPPFPISLHIFIIDQIPSLYIQCLEKLSSYFTFTFYFFSPSPLFWGDLISRKKSAYLDKLFKKKNTSIEERIDFAKLSHENHALLAHFCDFGKPLYKYLHEHENEQDYADVKMTSNLTYIQKALLYQIKPEKPPFDDATFSIHKAPSLLREIEIVTTNILSTLKENPSLTPNDIAVLAPDIDIYFPYISFVFSGNEFPFSYTISNLKKIRHSSCLYALSLLFSLINSRFEKDDVIKLFRLSFFQRKCQINQEDIDILEKIIDHTGIRWGFDDKSKSIILNEKNPCSFGLFDKGFTHIINLLSEKDSPIEFSQVESIGDLIALIKDLHNDLSNFANPSKTLDSWLEITTNFAQKYLYIDEEGEFFFKELRKISSLAKQSKYLYPFESFKRLIDEIFSKKGAWEKTYQKPPITFSSIESSPPINKAIFFIGLDEENFPKKDTIRSLNELSSHPLYEKKISPAKKARYYLLKAICSANTSISFSYTSNNPTDGKQKNPSPLLEEIIHSLCLNEPIQHPFTPFSPSYFTKEHVLQRYYMLHKCSKTAITSPYTFTKVYEENKNEKTIEIRELSLLSRSPPQFFYNLSTGLYENKYFTPTMFDDSEFILSYLDKAIIKRNKVKETSVNFNDLIKTNKLPTALFEKAAKQELTLEIKTEKNLYRSFLGTEDPYISLQLDPHIKKPLKKQNKSFLPAINIKYKNCNYCIKGSVLHLTAKGFICLKKPSPAETWKLLPSLIILSHLPVDIPTTINFLSYEEYQTFSKEKLKPLIFPLISYYEKSLENISPFIPEAISEYISKNAIAFDSLKTKLLSRFYDPYLEKSEAKDHTYFEEELKALSSIIKGESSANI